MGRKIIQNSEKESRWKFTKLTSEYFKDHKEEFETISISDDFEFLSINEDSNFFANTYFTSLKNAPFNNFKIKIRNHLTIIYNYYIIINVIVE